VLFRSGDGRRCKIEIIPKQGDAYDLAKETNNALQRLRKPVKEMLYNYIHRIKKENHL
jgi:hypothetical protein